MNIFNQLSIRSRLILLGVSALMALLAVGGLGSYSLYRVQSEFSSFAGNEFVTQGRLIALRANLGNKAYKTDGYNIAGLGVLNAYYGPPRTVTVGARLRRQGGCENDAMRTARGSSRSPGWSASLGSSGSILSIGSTGSVLSIGASGGFFSIGNHRVATDREHDRNRRCRRFRG